MKKRRVITSDELLRELQQDPKWVARRQADEERRRHLERQFYTLEQPILADLRRIGVSVSTIGEVASFRKYLPLPPEIIAVLARWLPEAHWRLKEPIARLLAYPSQPYDGRTLAEVFDDLLKYDLDQRELDEGVALANLGWVIGNTIAEGRPYGLSDWIVKKITDPLIGKSKEMLLLALARLVERSKAIPLLESMFDEFPAHCALALGEIGGHQEGRFLKRKQTEYQGEPRRAIQRAIEAIQTR